MDIKRYLTQFSSNSQTKTILERNYENSAKIVVSKSPISTVLKGKMLKMFLLKLATGWGLFLSQQCSYHNSVLKALADLIKYEDEINWINIEKGEQIIFSCRS